MRIQHLYRAMLERAVISRSLQVGFIYSLAVGGLSAIVGCSAVDVNSPTRLTQKDLQNALGADLAVEGARAQLYSSWRQAVIPTGLIADEFYRRAGPTDHNYEVSVDRRQREEYLHQIQGQGGVTYGSWQEVWVRSTVAMSVVQKYAQPVKKGVQLGELFAIRGFAMLNMAEQICPGFPVRHLDASDLSNLTPDFASVPLTTDSAFALAVAQFDSALVHADSARVLNFARVGKARALLGRGKFAEAAAVAALVEPGFTTTIMGNFFDAFVYSVGIFVSDGEGGNGIDFASAADPRTPMTLVEEEYWVEGLPHYAVPSNLMSSEYVPVVIVSDLEARLIEAEAALYLAPNDLAWLATVNALRQTIALDSLSDPGTTDARRDLFFRERAFWLYATGHRLGDLRRLIHQYGQDPEAVFPTGPIGEEGWAGSYSNATSLAFDGDFEHIHNSSITGCTEL